MSVRIIVVGDGDFYDDVYELWKDKFDGKGGPTVRSPEQARYLERAEDRLKEEEAEFPVVIVHQRARLNTAEKGDPDLATMVERLGRLRERHMRSRVVLCLYDEQLRTELVIPLLAAKLEAVQGSNVETMREHILVQINEGIRRAASNTPSSVETIAEFRFHLQNPELQVHYLTGENCLEGPCIQIHGEIGLMQRFLESSCEVDKLANQQPGDDRGRKLSAAMKELDKVGSEIITHDALVKEYNKLANAPFTNHVRFQITTSAKLYPCLFEALRFGARARPVVVEHPAYRSVHFGEDLRPRLEWSPANPVNILVVVADLPAQTRTVVNEGEQFEVSFRSLPFVEEEAKLFSRFKEAYDNDKLLEPADGEDGDRVTVAIGQVDILRYEHDKPLLSKRLKTALKNSNYKILHFIGHAYGHPLPDNTIDTRLVLPTGDPKAAEALTLYQLESWLDKPGIQFVYLSCCSGIPTQGGAGVISTSASVALLLKSIPVTLGFRWNVLDECAFKFAKDFYAELFVHACGFDEAMQRARCKIYNAHGGSNTMWISPVLLQGHSTMKKRYG